MNGLDLNQLAAPTGLFLSAFAAWALGRLSVYLREKTKNERLSRLANFAGHIAGDIHDSLEDLPPGSDLAAAKAIAIQTGVADLRAATLQTVAKLGGASDARLTGILKGELGQLRAAAAPATIVVPTGPQPILVSTDAPAT